MVWHRGASDDEPEVEPSMPWRAAAPSQHAATAKKILVEAWDDELPPPESQAKQLVDTARSNLPAWTVRALRIGLFTLAGLGALAGLYVAWMHVVSDPLADAHAYWEAASRLNAGQPLYPAGVDPNGNHIFLYPPLLAIVFRPLALLPFEAFALIWELVVVGCFVALVRRLGVRRPSTWAAIGLLGIPIGWALTIAQAHVPMTLLLAIGQPWSIALAANLKLTPVLIAIWWLGRRDFESFFAFLAWMALFAAAQLALAWDASFAFFRNVGVEQLGRVNNWSPYVQSPALWFGLVIIGALVTLALARTRWGWAAAVTLVTLSPPRLLVYMFTGLLAALREPKVAGTPDPDDRSDPVRVYTSSAR